MIRSYKPALNFVLPLVFCLLTVGGGLVALKVFYGSWWPENASLLYVDAGWYHSIVRNGYVFDPNAANNTAFFPLFPYTWKLLGVGATGIVVFNILIFSLGCYFLLRTFPSHGKVKLLFLSLTLLVFYATPMSESLFFFFSTLLLTGLEKRKPLLAVAGLIGAGLCRSVTMVFFPALLALALFAWLRGDRLAARRYLLYSLLAIAVLFSVFFIHYVQTGEFWAFYHTQQFWFAHFQIPDIPFSTWPPEENSYIDQFAVLLTFFAAGYLVSLFFKALKKRAVVSDAHLFALLYMAGTLVLMLFTKGGGFNSVNRYILSTPFFYLFLREVRAVPIFKSVAVGLFVFGVIYYLVGWHMGVGMHRVLVFLAVLAGMGICLLALKKDTRLASVFLLFFSMLALCVQAILWSRFVTHVWVG